MAKVIVDEQKIVVKPWWERARVVFVGAGLGLCWWVVTALLSRYVVEPLGCRDLSNGAATCTDSFGVAGNVAMVLIALLGTAVLVRGFYHRPLLITVASAAVLWGLGTFLTGLAWYEALLWSVVLYVAAYALFSLVARIKMLGWAIIIAAVIVLTIRLLLVL